MTGGSPMAGSSAGSSGSESSSPSSLRFFAASAVIFVASFCQRSSHSATFPPQART